MANPLIAQGSLNRLRASVTIPAFPGLNITSSYMGKSFVTVTFDGDFDKLIGTGTGAVTSPEPYVEANVVVSLLRTQALSGAWLAQAQTLSDIGNVSIFPDSTAFPEIDLVSCVIQHVDPGAFDGLDPIVKLNLKGVFLINNNLWAM